MKKGMTRRRWLALVLCLAMLFSCVPQGAIPVFAAGDDTASQGQPETGETPTEPEVTTEPTEPEDTTAPTEPEVTTEPTEPEDTTAPTEPEVTTEPTEPEVTTEPTEPQNSAESAQPQNPAVPLAGEAAPSGKLTDTITYSITLEEDSDGIAYYVLTLEGTGAMPDYDYNTYQNAPWYPYCDSLRQVIVDEEITSIGAYAFYSKYLAVTSLQLPSTLTIIGKYAFSGCHGLTTVDLRDCTDLLLIDDGAFQGCSGLTTLNLRECTKLVIIGSNAFKDCVSLSVVDLNGISGLANIKSDAFQNCSGLTTVDLNGCTRLTTIGDRAFQSCRSLTTVDLNGCYSLATIGRAAFQGCRALNTLDLHDLSGLKAIGSNAFEDCSGLSGALDFSNCQNLANVGEYAFQNCIGLTSVNFSGCNSLTQIRSSTFEECSGLTTVNLNGCSNLTEIRPSAFQNCRGLTTLDLNNLPKLESIHADAFLNCTSLTGSLDFSNHQNLAFIGYRTFQSCKGLTSVNFSGCHSLATIDRFAFQNCTGLTSVDLSDCTALTTISIGTFSNCSSLTSFTLKGENRIERIEDPSAFSGTAVSAMTIQIPDAASAKGITCILETLQPGLKWVSLDAGSSQKTYFGTHFLETVQSNSYRISFSPGFYTFSQEEPGAVLGAVPLNTLEGPAWVDSQGVVYLLDQALYTASLAYIPSDLESYTVPATVRTPKGSYALTSISSRALARAYQLKEITFDKPEDVTLEAFAMAGCTTLVSVNEKTTVEEAESLFAPPVGESAFLDTGLLESPFGTQVPSAQQIVVSSNPNAQFTLTVKSPANPWDQDTTGTGNPVTLTAYIDGSQVQDYWYRIYFLISGRQFDLGGLQMEVGKSYTDSNGVTYTFSRHAHLGDLYYVDVLVPAGATWNKPFSLNYPALTPGGQVLVWAECGEKTAPSEPQSNPTGEYYRFTWETEAVPYQMSVTNTTKTYGYMRPDVNQPITLSSDLSWQVRLAAQARSKYKDYASLAQNPFRQAVHTMTFSLPEGFSWNEVLRNALGRGGQPLNLRGGYWCLGNTPVMKATLDSTKTYIQKVSAALVDGKLVLTVWQTAKNLDSLAALSISPTLMQSSVVVKEDIDVTAKHTVALQVDTKLLYTFGLPVSLTGNTDWTSTSPKKDLTYKKTASGTSLEYTGRSYYQLLADNETIYDHSLTKISDPLPTELFITPQGIRELFTLSGGGLDNQALAEHLTLTISHARRYRYKGDNALGYVTLANGGMKCLLTADMTDEYDVPYDEDVTATIMLGKENGTLSVSFNGADSEDVPMEELDFYLKTHGLALLKDTQYTVTWNFGENSQISSGDAYLLQIPVEPKNTFQLLAADGLFFRGATTQEHPSAYNKKRWPVTNQAAFVDPKENIKSQSNTYLNDYAIEKTVNKTSVQNGDVLKYTVTAYRSGSAKLGLPMVDVISGPHCLLVPVASNRDQPWAKGLKIWGEGYDACYMLEIPAGDEDGQVTYEGVWLESGYGVRYAESVTVTDRRFLSPEKAKKYFHEDYTDLGSALADDGYVTEIRLYLPDSPSYSEYNVEYRVLADMGYSHEENALSGTIRNIAYLNDRDNQRLFCPSGDGSLHVVTGDKELLNDDKQPAGENGPVSAGETIHYRLTVENLLKQNVTVAPEHVKDILPDTFDVFQWTTENVNLSYALKSGNPTNNFAWEISYDEEQGVYVINWLNSLEIPADDTIYIYVDLTFPADSPGGDSAWKKYCEAVKGGTLINTFHLINGRYSVTHNLALPGSAYIQKGVLQSEYFEHSIYSAETSHGFNHDFRYYSERIRYGYTTTMKETFYVLIYNAGPGPLYLSQVQDHFPKGAFISPDRDGIEISLITEPGYFAELPEDFTLVQASFTVQMGNSYMNIGLSPSSAEKGMPTITYDEAAKAYYLKPNQAVAFSYEVRLDTDLDHWDNTVAMPLYDPHNTGVGVAQILQVHYSHEMDGKIGNDGLCTYWTAKEGEDFGYTSDFSTEGWVSSSVTLRKESVAGLEKRLVQKRGAYGGESVPYPGYAGPMDSLQWELKIYNDGFNVIDGIAIKEVLPVGYILDVGDLKVINDRDLLPFSLSIAEVTVENNKMKSALLEDGTVITVGGDWWSKYRCEIRLYYNEDDQLVMELKDNRTRLYPGEDMALTFWTKNCTNSSLYTTYLNSAILTTRQELNYDKVSRGRVQYDDAGKPVGILAKAVAVIAGGYSTGSEKTVTELENPYNDASSKQNGSITLSKGENHFTYELQVDNRADSTNGIQWITLIDNLPQIDDTMTMTPSMPRGSQFQVEFAEKPNVKVWYTTQDGTPVNIPNAEIRYSGKVKFTDADWGIEGPAPSSDGWSEEPSSDARSIRIYIPSNGETPAVPAGATLHVSFECQVGAEAGPGEIAWNSFGYCYLMSNDTFPLKAAPLEVGVRIPNTPQIQKVLTNKIGEMVTAQEDTKFNFLVYEGERISGNFATGAELLRALADAKINFTIATVTVLKGESQAELKLENLKICTYTPENGWKETENPWAWKDGESYTVVELGDKLTVGLGSYQDYEFASLDYVPDNSYTFRYNKSTTQLIRGENTLMPRRLQIQKVDQADQNRKLPGAVFGLYSSNPNDKLSDKALQTAATALGLTPEQIQELKSGKLTCTVGEKTYHLYRLGKTDENGLITWDDLPEMSYCYVELWAPEGYYIPQNDPVEVSFQEGDAYLRSITHTVTNKQIVYLPKTGGMGRWQIPALGLILCAAVVTVFLGKRRKKAA